MGFVTGGLPGELPDDLPGESLPEETPAAGFMPPAFRFPGRWTRIPMTDAAARDAAIGELVRSNAGAVPSPLVDEARRGIAGALAAASAEGLVDVYVGAPVTTGVPVTAMMLIHAPSIRLSVARGVGAAEVMDAFLEGLARRGSAAELERFGVGASEVCRTVSVRAASVEPPRAGELRVHFWVTVPGAKQVVPLVFTSPFVDLHEPLTALFSAVVSTLTWPGSR